MKFGSIRSSLVRWFKGSATSVTPEIEPASFDPSLFGGYSMHSPEVTYGGKVAADVFAARVQGDPPPQVELDALGEQVLAQLKASGLVSPDASVRVRSTPVPKPSLEPAPSQAQGPVKPPADRAIDDAPPWSWWEAQRGFPIPGWSFCRFGARYGDKTMFAFGWTRGPFGLHQAPFRTCRGFYPDIAVGKKLLVNATHLLTGHMIGLFDTMSTAIDACELAERLDKAWASESAMTPAMDAAIARTNAAWMGVGIVVSTSEHAHANEDEDAERIHIITRTVATVMDGQPARSGMS